MKRKRLPEERVPLFRSPEELAQTYARRLVETGEGRAALEALKGSALSTATRCACGVYILRASRHRVCPTCDARIEHPHELECDLDEDCMCGARVPE